MATRPVLIDTCQWAQYFNRPQSREREVIGRLIEENSACVTGPIIVEVLSGFKNVRQADWVASVLDGLSEIELAWEDWRLAAKLNRELISRGHHLPLADLLSATAAIRNDLVIYSTDPHFRLFSQVRLFDPAEVGG